MGGDSDDLIKKSIILVQSKVGIKRHKKVSEGGILMKVKIEEKFEKLENEVNTNGNLKGKFTIKKTDKARPKKIMYGTNKKTENQEFVKSHKKTLF